MQFRRRAFQLATAASAGVSVLALVLWVRSCFTSDYIGDVRVVGGTTVTDTFLSQNRCIGWERLHETHWTAPPSGFFAASDLPDQHHQFLLQGRGGFLFEKGVDMYVQAGVAFFRVGVPDWFLAALGAVLPAFSLAVRRRENQRTSAGRCRRCGYDLRASAGHCPECGHLLPADHSPSVTGAVQEGDAARTNDRAATAAAAAAPGQRS